jgi:hypothetical protein
MSDDVWKDLSPGWKSEIWNVTHLTPVNAVAALHSIQASFSTCALDVLLVRRTVTEVAALTPGGVAPDPDTGLHPPLASQLQLPLANYHQHAGVHR